MDVSQANTLLQLRLEVRFRAQHLLDARRTRILLFRLLPPLAAVALATLLATALRGLGRLASDAGGGGGLIVLRKVVAGSHGYSFEFGELLVRELLRHLVANSWRLLSARSASRVLVQLKTLFGNVTYCKSQNINSLRCTCSACSNSSKAEGFSINRSKGIAT